MGKGHRLCLTPSEARPSGEHSSAHTAAKGDGMKQIFIRSHRHRVVCALVASLGLAASLATPHAGLAAFTSCKSDPTVLLSNGAVLDLQADIADSYGTADVKSVQYTIHVPKGLTV